MCFRGFSVVRRSWTQATKAHSSKTKKKVPNQKDMILSFVVVVCGGWRTSERESARGTERERAALVPLLARTGLDRPAAAAAAESLLLCLLRNALLNPKGGAGEGGECEYMYGHFAKINTLL